VRLVPLDAAILRRGPFLIEDVDPKPTLILVFKFSYSLAVLVLPAPHNVRLLFNVEQPFEFVQPKGESLKQ
jgi:hypothetical protein